MSNVEFERPLVVYFRGDLMKRGELKGKKRTGITFAVQKIMFDGYEYYAFGAAECSKKEQFVKKVGRDKAIGRMTGAIEKFTKSKVKLGQLIEKNCGVFHSNQQKTCSDVIKLLYEVNGLPLEDKYKD